MRIIWPVMVVVAAVLAGVGLVKYTQDKKEAEQEVRYRTAIQ